MTGSFTLVGRESECRLINELVTAAAPRGGALVLTGEPGIGKTALLDYAADAVSSDIVLRTRGVESETVLPFAALADVLLPLRGHLASLPNAQRVALEVCLALSVGPMPDTYAVCAGALSLLTMAAVEDSLVILVDDMQWIDPCSRRALLFVARRILGEQIVVLLALQGHKGDPNGAADLPSVEIPGLSVADCAELLRRHGIYVSTQIAREFARWSGGNPLALLEAALSLRPAQLSGEEPMPELPSVGQGLEQAWLSRICGLPATTRNSLTIMAASRTPSVSALESALTIAGLSLDMLIPAEEAGLLSATDNGYEFRHAVLRSVVMRRTPLADRLRIFRVLAEASSGTQRALYLAAAATGPDEDIARSLVAAAYDGRRRGAFAAAARTWRRAADVTPDPEVRAERLFEAATDAFLGGASTDAVAWCEEALSRASDPLLHADIELLRGRVSTWLGHPAAAHQQLVEAANAVRAVDSARACALLAEAIIPAAMDNQFSVALNHAVECRDLATDAAVMSVSGAVLHGSVLILTGQVPEGRAILDKWADALADADPVRDQQFLTLGAQAHSWADSDDESRRLLTRVIETARHNGAPAALPIALGARAELEWWQGRWAAAYADAADALRWAEELQHTSVIGYALSCIARLDVHRGDRPRYEEHIARARRNVGPFAIGSLEIYLTSILGAAALTHGDYETAIAQLENTFARAIQCGLGNPVTVPYLADLAEAHIRNGNTDRALEILNHLERQAQATGLAWPQAAAARNRMLLADSPADAEKWFDAAEAAHYRRDMPFEHARTLLCRGEVLRRSRRPGAAREPLLAALATFESLGAVPWTRRTAAELAATGQPVVALMEPSAFEELTTQELQVARVIARGMSNDQAASALFISRKTVEAHLTRIYRKLGIRSRTDLTRALVSAGLVD
jgi:DNA-binding CsgD family transcriptional regulator